jgi:hypothetical protein
LNFVRCCRRRSRSTVAAWDKGGDPNAHGRNCGISVRWSEVPPKTILNRAVRRFQTLGCFNLDAQPGVGMVSSLDPSVRKLSTVAATAHPAITAAMGMAGFSRKPRNVVQMAAIRN